MLDRNISKGSRKKVLLLGISYPCVSSQMEKHGYPQDILTHSKPSVEQAVECVRRGIMTEMDARDLARCVATEQATDTEVYTVSKEIGAVYRSDRHVHANFNARNFSRTLQMAFGEDIQFSQVILDYYWMPTGWLVTRWAKTLFQQTLPDLVRKQMLTFPSRRKQSRRGGNFLEEGVVYLPFCAHVCKELVGGIHILEQYYSISFVHKKDLHGHSLWKGTMEIDGETMQHRLGKRLDQEEIYCTFRPKDIYESMEDPHVSKPQVMRILLAIENYEDIRMVKLKPLRQHERASVFRERLYSGEIGGFQGLNFALAKKLFHEMKRGPKGKFAIRAEKSPEGSEKVQKVKVQKRKYTKRKKVAENAEAVAEKPAKIQKVSKPQTKRPEIEEPSVPMTPIYSEVEEPNKEELEQFLFYPGPVCNLETYNDPEGNAGHVQRGSTESTKLEIDSPEAAKISTPVLEKTGKKGKGIVVLSDDEMEREPKACPFQQPDEYLAFNPRKRPPRSPYRIRRRGRLPAFSKKQFMELDWSLVKKNNQDRKPEVHNDLEAASTLYFCMLRGFGVRKKPGRGRKKATGVKDIYCLREMESPTDGKIRQLRERVCFVVDNTKCDFESITGYRLKSNEELKDAMKVEIPIRAVIEACRGEGSWEKLLDEEDRLLLAGKFQQAFNSKKPSGRIDVVSAADRIRNLSNIIKWLLGGKSTEDDPTGCFQILEQVSDQKATTSLGRLASDMERNLFAGLRAIAGCRTLLRKSIAEEVKRAARCFKGVDSGTLTDIDAASVIQQFKNSFEKDQEKLVQSVVTWLNDRSASNDPTGEFLKVDQKTASNANHTIEERANEIASRVEFLRSVAHILGSEIMIHSSGSDDKCASPRKARNACERDFVESLAMIGSRVIVKETQSKESVVTAETSDVDESNEVLSRAVAPQEFPTTSEKEVEVMKAIPPEDRKLFKSASQADKAENFPDSRGRVNKNQVPTKSKLASPQKQPLEEPQSTSEHGKVGKTCLKSRKERKKDQANESLQHLQNSSAMVSPKKNTTPSFSSCRPRFSKKKRANLDTLDSLTLTVQKPCTPTSPQRRSSTLPKGKNIRTDMFSLDRMLLVTSPRAGQAGDSLAHLDVPKPCTDGYSPGRRGRRRVAKSKPSQEAVHQVVVSTDDSSDGGSAGCATPSPARSLSDANEVSNTVPRTTRHPIGRPVTPRDVLTSTAVAPTEEPVSVLEECQTAGMRKHTDNGRVLSVHGSVESPQRHTLKLHT